MTAQKRNKSIYTGVAILLVGLIWLLRKMGLELPYWLLSWEMLLIAIGAIIGIDTKFKNPTSYILMAIGSVFLIDDVFGIPFRVMDYFWPLLVITVGLVIIFQSRIRAKRVAFNGGGGDSAKGDKLDTISVFNGVKRSVLSKDFQGGEVVTIFGGTELNLMQADFTGHRHLEVTVLFGGAKLIIPRNWEVRPEVTTIFGGVDDKRLSAVEIITEDDKILTITGTVVFGGLDIVNY